MQGLENNYPFQQLDDVCYPNQSNRMVDSRAVAREVQGKPDLGSAQDSSSFKDEINDIPLFSALQSTGQSLRQSR